MADEQLSIWKTMQIKGYPRREFLKFCNFALAAAGLEGAGLTSVVRAFETKPRPPVVWLHFLECTCCSESFIRSSHPIVSDVLLDVISLDYTETLQAAAEPAPSCVGIWARSRSRDWAVSALEVLANGMARGPAKTASIRPWTAGGIPRVP